jgi:hypothetical protein
MKKISVIGATLVAAAVLCAAPISLHLSQDKGISLSGDKAQARIGRPLTPGSNAVTPAEWGCASSSATAARAAIPQDRHQSFRFTRNLGLANDPACLIHNADARLID